MSFSVFCRAGSWKENGAMADAKGDKWFTVCAMDDVPHISAVEREKLAASHGS
jgi:hypothetical protein